MPYLLNIFYVILLVVASPWIVWSAVRTGKYREGYAEKLLGLAPRRTSNKKCIWLHAVSVGEVNLLAPLLRLIQCERPDWECVISTTTKSGMALAKKKCGGWTVFYCPLDFTWAVNAAMRRIRPDVLVLAELELWPNLVWSARRHGAAVAVINGRLSQQSFEGYCRIRPLVSRLLGSIDCIAVQDGTYAERFRALGARPETVQVTGSMKYDGAQTDRDNAATRRLATLAGLAANDMVFLAGSTQEPEESLALQVFQHLSGDWPQLRLIIVPRHPERFDCVARMLDASGVAWQRRTLLGAGSREQGAGNKGSGPLLAAPCPQFPPRVLLVDVVGELGDWWGTAHVAFVGGSLGNRGGQNMIEPAAYGAAVSFGPNTRNFRDIVAALLERDAAVVVADGKQLLAFVRNCLANPAEAAARGQRAASLVLQQLGATERTFQLLLPLAVGPQPAANGNRRAA
ncbi:MAG: 3-deoxy-D-manno-octulosonic acid transferase [Thermoguttaceae bacterium]